jgi:hypothetical protein
LGARCVNNEHLEASLQRFSDRRDAIYKLVLEQVEGLKGKEANWMLLTQSGHSWLAAQAPT